MAAVGSLITPSIRLVREIGAGGMGSIWVADHLALHTQVVVKFMHAQIAQDQDSLARFTREAASAANVKSPHVVQVLDHGVTPEGSAFIVMELLEGVDLAAWIEGQGALPLPQVALIISQTCKALARAHERGIVHRDIKPQNIFLSQVGEGEVFVKVLDFGIAKASVAQQSIGNATKTGTLMGTPYYMSPEQTVGAKGIDHRTDLWALGVVAYEAMTGRRPFEAETIGGLAVAICNGPIPLPSQVHPGLPREVDAWFAKACAREPAQRFQSAKEMSDALQLAINGTVERSSLGSARTLPLATPPPANALQLTTHAPMSGDEVQGVPKRGSVAIPLAIGGFVLLAGVVTFVVGMTHRRHELPSAALVTNADPVKPAVAATSLEPLAADPVKLPVMDPSPRPTSTATSTIPTAAARAATTGGAKKPVASSSAATAASVAPVGSVKPVTSPKPAVSTKSDRFSID